MVGQAGAYHDERCFDAIQLAEKADPRRGAARRRLRGATAAAGLRAAAARLYAAAASLHAAAPAARARAGTGGAELPGVQRADQYRRRAAAGLRLGLPAARRLVADQPGRAGPAAAGLCRAGQPGLSRGLPVLGL